MIAQRYAVCLCVVVVSLLLANLAWADGKVFARAVAAPVKVPDQRAMLYFSNGVERLVIETSFVGEGTNFAWVIPLPSAPKIEAVSTNFFRVLGASFQPKLIYSESWAWMYYAFIGAIVGIGIRAHRKGTSLVGCLGVVLLLFVLFVLALPNFVMTRGVTTASTKSGGVSLLDRRSVGVYETATLSGKDGSELLAWLNSNGFYTSTSALPVISSYATQGWVFAAATINRDLSAQTQSQLHPLAFAFHSEKAVYPLRLTGVENGSCSIELFIFGPERAEVAGFQVEHCGNPFRVVQTSTDDLSIHKERFAPPEPGEYRVGNPEILGLAMPASVVTKLVGLLRPDDMRSDGWISWVPFRPALPTLYSRGAAMDAALNLSVAVSVLGALIVQLLAPKLSLRTRWRALFGITAVAVAAGLLLVETTKTTEVEFLHGGWLSAENDWRQLDGALQQFRLERHTSAPLEFNELQSALDEYIKGGARNAFTREPLRKEPSPGNITLRRTTSGVEVLWYDIDGIGCSMITFTNAAN